MCSSDLAEGKKILTVGEQSSSDIQILRKELNNVSVMHKNKGYNLRAPLPVMHNLHNLSMSSCVAHELGIPYEKVKRYMSDFTGISGRFELFHLENNVTVVVDYAHTQDALEIAINTAINNGANHVITVYGFAGNRDTSKRKAMLEIVTRLSDSSILKVTELFGSTSIVMDRTLAIQKAIKDAQPGDCVLLLGKGHEQYKENYALNTKSDQETVLYLQKNKLSTSGH